MGTFKPTSVSLVANSEPATRLNGKGAPTSLTKGAVGDIYVDTATGDKYKCTLSFGTGDDADCTWKKMQSGVEAKPIAEKKKEAPKPEPIVKPAPEKIDISEEPAKPIEKKAQGENPDKPSYNRPVNKSNRTNYSKAYKKN